jgi:DNA polymerase-3 subunit delta'
VTGSAEAAVGSAGVGRSAPALAGTEDHPHARIVLGSALAAGDPSHAYLFHGPAGTGKATVARAFAAELLADGDPDPDDVRRRVRVGAHPDLTWVRPSGAHVMRVDDVEGPVIAAAARTPFEARRRVFVLERAETMNDEVANRMLKTLEEPASFVHIVLLTDALGQMLETVVSRCQSVRFDPLPPERIAATLTADGVPGERAEACARLALGNARRARMLASDEGDALRTDAERLVLDALAEEPGADGDDEPWRGLLDRAEERRAAVEEASTEETTRRLELEPKGRERKALERELEEAAKRDGRRARTEVLDLGLELAALGFRDLACVAEDATAAVLGVDRIAVLGAAAEDRGARRLRDAVERCDETRQSLELNVTEELALSALTFRLRRLLAGH